MSDEPTCEIVDYSSGQVVLRPELNSTYSLGDPLDVVWYLGNSPFNSSDETYSFKVSLRSAFAEIDRPLIVDNAYGQGSPQTQRFTSCNDYQVNETLPIPSQLDATQRIFAVVIEYVGTRNLPGWEYGARRTGHNFEIDPTATTSSTPTSKPTGGGGGSSGDSSGPSAARLIGLGVGLAVLLVAIFLAIWWVVRWKRQKIQRAKWEEQQQQQQQNYFYEHPGGVPGNTPNNNNNQRMFIPSPQQQMYSSEERHEILAENSVHELPRDLKSPVWEMGGTTPGPELGVIGGERMWTQATATGLDNGINGGNSNDNNNDHNELEGSRPPEGHDEAAMTTGVADANRGYELDGEARGGGGSEMRGEEG